MKKKPTPKKAPQEIPILKDKSLQEFLETRESDEMLDDHGQVIIGSRDKKPRLPEEEE